MTLHQNYIYISIAIAVVIVAGSFVASRYGLFFQGASAYVSTDTRGLPAARPAETVELKNGDTYDLTAGYVRKEINGTEYRMLAYNGSIPGPLIKVAQGSEVSINFKNSTDMKTLLHSHGVRMDNAFDGSQTTQIDMAPGETFLYKLKFTDAGMFWYHQHVREDFGQELGLYGNYLVTLNDPKYWSSVDREVPLFLDDILIENERILLNKDAADRTLMGRFGNVMLINGETNYSLSVKKGEVVRFYITNAANVRPYNFAIEGPSTSLGASARMKLVGGDSGAYERDQWVDAVLIGPSERAVVEVLFDESGTYALQSKTPEKTYELGAIVVSEESAVSANAASFAALKTRDEVVQSIDPLRPYFAREPDKRLRLSIEMSVEMQNMIGGDMSGMEGMGGMEGMDMGAGRPPEDGIEWEEGDSETMNRMSNADNVTWNMIDDATGQKNIDIDWEFKKGQPVKIRITNDAQAMHPMQHPIHFHGQRFLIVNKNGVEQTNLAWEDTVTVPAGQYVDIVLDTSNPGTWMAHCHIPEHMEAGMMFDFKVTEYN